MILWVLQTWDILGFCEPMGRVQSSLVVSPVGEGNTRGEVTDQEHSSGGSRCFVPSCSCRHSKSTLGRSSRTTLSMSPTALGTLGASGLGATPVPAHGAIRTLPAPAHFHPHTVSGSSARTRGCSRERGRCTRQGAAPQGCCCAVTHHQTHQMSCSPCSASRFLLVQRMD